MHICHIWYTISEFCAGQISSLSLIYVSGSCLGHCLAVNHYVSLAFPWLCQYLRLSLFPWWPWQFWAVMDKHFVKHPPTAMYLFLITGLGLWILGKKTTRMKCHCQHIISGLCTINMTCHYWYRPWSLAEAVCQVSPLQCYLPYYSIIFRNKPSGIAHTSGAGFILYYLFWGGGELRKLSGILL